MIYEVAPTTVMEPKKPLAQYGVGLFCCLAGTYSCVHFGRETLCPVQNTSGFDNTMRLLFDIGDKSYCRKILNLWAGKPGSVHSLCKMRWTRGMQPTSGCVCINGAARPVNWQNAEADRLKTPHPRRFRWADLVQ